MTETTASIETDVAARLTLESPNGTKHAPIIGFPGYIIGDDGSVWSLWRACGDGGGQVISSIPRRRKLKMPKPESKIKRYPQVGLKLNGKTNWKSIHLLVITTFKGPKPESRMECRHLDGNRFNFNLSNLIWGTKAENQQDKERHGTCQRGRANGRAKLNEDEVLELRRKRTEGHTLKALTFEFGIAFTTVFKIENRLLWKNV